jgi:hypothetical protein
MTLKPTDLERNKGKKIEGALRRTGVPDRFGAAAGEVVDRREQRRRDAAAGLVPFAVKLPGTQVKALHALAQSRQVTLDVLVAELLQKGLDAAG